MDYSKLSDIEIDTMVSKICSPEFHRNYCRNPADAWPIIIGNGISLYHDNGNWQAEMTYYAPVGAFGTDETCSKFVDDKNPLRAAMIVFLMMQEAK
ncbi:TPA: DUF2591 family protein [Klebsiella aerogenes]|nr:DUF2591 family protein [Klebsiella aerogenes]